MIIICIALFRNFSLTETVEEKRLPTCCFPSSEPKGYAEKLQRIRLLRRFNHHQVSPWYFAQLVCHWLSHFSFVDQILSMRCSHSSWMWPCIKKITNSDHDVSFIQSIDYCFSTGFRNVLIVLEQGLPEKGAYAGFPHLHLKLIKPYLLYIKIWS